MTGKTPLTIHRDIEDIKGQVRKELDMIRDLMGSLSYWQGPPGWSLPYQIHRLRRSLRIHYLAMKIRDAQPIPTGRRELLWSLEPNAEV